MNRFAANALLLAIAIGAPMPRPLAAQQPQASPAPSTPSPEELQALRDAKLARPAFQKATWHTDYDAARAAARAADKAVLAYFTRSFPPSPESDALENTVLADPRFLDLAKQFVLFVHCASRTKGEPRPRLLHELGMAVLPTVALLDADGKLLAQQRLPTLGAIAGTAEKARALVDARAAVRKGDVNGPKLLFLAELDLDALTIEQIRERLPAIALADTERATVDRAVVDAELVALQRQQVKLGHDTVCREIATIHAAGRRPNERYSVTFWAGLLAHAVKTKNGPLANEAVPELLRRQDPNQDQRTTLRQREDWERMRVEANAK